MTGWIVAAIAGLILALWALGKYTRGDPREMIELARRHGRRAAGLAMLAFGAVFAARGNWLPLLVLGPIGFALVQGGGGPLLGGASGRRSVLRTVFLEIVVDHDTGAMTGLMLAGAQRGRSLDTLDEAALQDLAREVAADPNSLGLLEAYLDRRFAGRRPYVDQNAGARQGGAGRAQAMTDQEAQEILGLDERAGPDEIRAAHRALIKRLHPDQGGSNWLAAKINEAKDVLMRRHR